MNRKPILWATVLAVAVMAALSAWAAPQLPEQVPVLFDFAGNPDRLGSRTEALIMIPLAALGLGAALWLLPLVFPRRQNLALSTGAYNAVGAAAMAFLTILHAALLLGGLGQPVVIGRLVPLAAGLLMIVIGKSLPKTRSNWIFGPAAVDLGQRAVVGQDPPAGRPAVRGARCRGGSHGADRTAAGSPDHACCRLRRARPRARGVLLLAVAPGPRPQRLIPPARQP